MILGDDVGYRLPTCDGGNLYSTPNIDSIARNGMRFTECHAMPSCSPSRVTLLTGKYNFRNYTSWGLLRLDQRTIANMFKDAGYKTGCFGKWQLSGGDQSLKAFGFDEYTVHDALDESQMGARYKSPHIYTHGAFLPASSTNNKYGPNIVSDSLLKFIETNKSVPFFIYYPMILSHQPYSPTPDDSAYASSIPITNSSEGDTAYFASMMHYMDIEIGKIIDKLKKTGLDKNTLIIYCADNGTPHNVRDYTANNQNVFGGKDVTTEAGTHVPMIAYWPGKILPGTINDNLIDFTDFLPSLASVANIPKPSDYGVLDGVDFSSGLFGQALSPRNSIFYHYDQYPQLLVKSGTQTFRRWAQTSGYKLYDTSADNNSLLFYNIIKDSAEENPIPDALLTATEKQIKQQLLDVINSYVLQGKAILSTPFVSGSTDTSIIISDTVFIDGGSTATASGLAWSTMPNPTILSSHTNENISVGLLTGAMEHLIADTVYYVRAYYTNAAGTAYSDEISVRTPPANPVATAATDVTGNSFIANWQFSNKAEKYKLDVSTSPVFLTEKKDSTSQGFDSTLKSIHGWQFTDGITVDSDNFGEQSPSVSFKTSNNRVITEKYPGVVSSLSFWLKAAKEQGGSFLIEASNGLAWQVVDQITDLTTNGTIKKYDFPATSNNPGFNRFRFSFFQTKGALYLDDVKVEFATDSSNFIPGYADLDVQQNSRLVKGLSKDSIYYYRVRTETIDGESGNSNVIAVKACKPSSIANIEISNLHCNGDSSGAVVLNVNDSLLNYNWIGPDNFTSSNKNISNLKAGQYNIAITSGEICDIDSSLLLTEPGAIKSVVEFDSLPCPANSIELKVNATDGQGDYTYRLLNKNDTSASQNENTFYVGTGDYTILISDANSCSVTTKDIPVKEIFCKPNRVEGFNVSIYPNPSGNQFLLFTESNSDENVSVYVTDAYGKKVYQSTGSWNSQFVFGQNFNAGIYFVRVFQGSNVKTVKIIKSN